MLRPPPPQNRAGGSSPHTAQASPVARGPSVLCPRRLEDPLPQPPYVALAVTRGDRVPSPRGRPLVRSRRGPPSPARMRVRSSVSNLPFGVSVLAGVTSKAHQAHVSSLSCQAFACIRPVMRDNRRRHGLPSRFPVSFRLPAFASWAFLSRQGIVPFSRSAYPAPRRARAGTPTGFPCSTRTRYGWVRVPPLLRGNGAHTADENASAAAVAPPRLALHSGPSPVFRSSE